MSGSGSGSKDNTRSEEFKRATAGVLRAIAQNNEVQVAFQPGPSGLAGKRARLPLPTRALPAHEMAKLRGAADSLALRLRHHDDVIHNARMPARREAKDAYDAIEQARVEVFADQVTDITDSTAAGSRLAVKLCGAEPAAVLLFAPGVNINGTALVDGFAAGLKPGVRIMGGLAGDDAAFVAKALGNIARAKGMSQLSRDTGLGRESLYKALSGEGNPSFATILKVASALGIRLHAQAAPGA